MINQIEHTPRCMMKTCFHSVLLRWNIQQNIIPIPKSKNPARLEENFFVFDFTLDDKDMQILNSMNENHRTSYNPLTFDF